MHRTGADKRKIGAGALASRIPSRCTGVSPYDAHRASSLCQFVVNFR